MCTSIAFKNSDFYFGRNMDLDYNFGQQVVITPRNYIIRFRETNNMLTHFSLIGMATILNDYPLYAEAANEKGLCMSSLNFPDNAYYSKELNPKKINIAPYEIIPWVLGQCQNIEDVKKLLENTSLVDIPFDDDVSVTTLHWHIADKNNSITLECTKSGMHVYDNPVHVLTNNPPFDFHMTNLALYLNLETHIPKNCFSQDVNIKPFCKGIGSIGLPGDFSSTSRFVKAAYLMLNSHCKPNENSNISQFFHLLGSVEVVNGSILLDNGREYMTTYTCCINADKGIYYYKTYDNNQITAINMYHEDINGQNLISFPLVERQQILWIN